MTRLVPAVLGLLCGTLLPSGTPVAAERCGIDKLELWATAAIPATARFAAERIGGLSGIEYEPRHDRFLAISDDRGAHGGTRIYRLRLHVSAAPAARIIVEAVSALPAPAFDAEALRINRFGTLYWASEGEADAGKGPGLHRLRTLHAASERLPVPSLLAYDPEQRRGPRRNATLEGIAVDPADGSLWLGLEAPLIEQAPLPTTEQGSTTAILHVANDTSAAQRFDYPLEPLAGKHPGLRADNGLAELLVLDGPALLVLERAGTEVSDKRFRFTTRLFCAWQDGDTPLLAKTKVADLTPMGHAAGIDFADANFEGMSFGPLLPDGRRSLVLVADNNFETDRPTLIAVFAVSP